MGGRSSGFSYNGNMSINKDLKRTDTFKDDKETTRDLRIIKKLKNRSIVVMKSSDIVPYDVITPNLKAVDKVLSQNRDIVEFLGENKVYIRAEEFENPLTQGAFSYYTHSLKDMEIIYSKSVYQGKDAKFISDNAENQIKHKHWSGSDKYNYVNKTILHELSHFIERVLVDRIAIARNETDIQKLNYNKYFNLKCNEIKEEILDVAKNKYNSQSEVVSKYGEDSVKEFFAEAYSEVLCTNKFEDLSPIAKATYTYMNNLKKEINK